jgi:hypothetical protein
MICPHPDFAFVAKYKFHAVTMFVILHSAEKHNVNKRYICIYLLFFFFFFFDLRFSLVRMFECSSSGFILRVVLELLTDVPEEPVCSLQGKVCRDWRIGSW